MPHDVASYLFGFSAALLMGLSKTGLPGASLPAVLLMAEAFPLDAKASVSAILPALCFGDTIAVSCYKRQVDWSRLWGLFPYVAIGMIPGVAVLIYSVGNQLRPILGWLVMALMVLELCRHRFGWDHLPHQWWFVGMLGVATGFGTVVGNAAGPIMIVYLISRGMLKEEFVGTCAWFFFIVNLSKVPILFAIGMVTADTLKFGLIVSLAVPIGSVLGDWALHRIPQRPFNFLAMSLAGAAAVRLIAW